MHSLVSIQNYLKDNQDNDSIKITRSGQKSDIFLTGIFFWKGWLWANS